MKYHPGGLEYFFSLDLIHANFIEFRQKEEIFKMEFASLLNGTFL